jgi:FlaA1/EpsC-like NDP-sugar epimerase
VGLLFGEWLAIGSFFLAVLLLMHTTIKLTIAAGIFFAISAYARSQFELFLNVILLVSMGLLLAMHYYNRSLNFKGLKMIKFLLVSLVVAQVLMLPWRLYHLQDGRGFSWVSTAAIIIQNGLSTDATLQEKGGNFVVLGGGNVACHIAPGHCGKSDSRTFFTIFLEHPFSWIKEKVQLLPSYWFAPVSKFTYPSTNPDFVDKILTSVLLFSLFLTAPLLWFVRKYAMGQMWVSIGLGLLASHVLIILFAHLEVRYFFFIKIYGVFSLLLLLVPFLNCVANLKRQKSRVN